MKEKEREREAKWKVTDLEQSPHQERLSVLRGVLHVRQRERERERERETETERERESR